MSSCAPHWAENQMFAGMTIIQLPKQSDVSVTTAADVDSTTANNPGMLVWGQTKVVSFKKHKRWKTSKTKSFQISRLKSLTANGKNQRSKWSFLKYEKLWKSLLWELPKYEFQISMCRFKAQWNWKLPLEHTEHRGPCFLAGWPSLLCVPWIHKHTHQRTHELILQPAV